MGPAEIAGLIAGMGIGIKVIDKLVDAILAKTRLTHSNSSATALNNVAEKLGALTAKIDWLVELQCDTRLEQKNQVGAVSDLKAELKVVHGKIDILLRREAS